jgi:hypothetical protein
MFFLLSWTIAIRTIAISIIDGLRHFCEDTKMGSLGNDHKKIPGNEAAAN